MANPESYGWRTCLARCRTRWSAKAYQRTGRGAWTTRAATKATAKPANILWRGFLAFNTVTPSLWHFNHTIPPRLWDLQTGLRKYNPYRQSRTQNSLSGTHDSAFLRRAREQPAATWLYSSRTCRPRYRTRHGRTLQSSVETRRGSLAWSY